ncbi:unnamed protein product, partial [Musa textilis]
TPSIYPTGTSPFLPSMATIFPDLSLHISPPSISEDGASMMGVSSGDQNSAASGSSESDMSHDRPSSLSCDQRREASRGEPTLTLGIEVPLTGSRDSRRHHQHHPQVFGFKRNPRSSHGRSRSSRAPRMRWTTALHAHFVHAVELLGGHESEHANPTFLTLGDGTFVAS